MASLSFPSIRGFLFLFAAAGLVLLLLPSPANSLFPSPPSFPTGGANAYRNGILSAFPSPAYSYMTRIFQTMDFSWLDSAVPFTLLVPQDSPALLQLLNEENSTLTDLIKTDVLPGVRLTLSDFFLMTQGGATPRVPTMLANRSVLVKNDNPTAGSVVFEYYITLDGVTITLPDAFISPDHRMVAHGIRLPLPATNIDANNTNVDRSAATVSAPPRLLLPVLISAIFLIIA